MVQLDVMWNFEDVILMDVARLQIFLLLNDIIYYHVLRLSVEN